MVRVHEPKGVGCETCHGISDTHSEDEDSLIPPDVIFPRQNVGAFCLQCHEKSELLETDDAHQKFFDGKSEKTCTNCHAMKHELKVRTRRWDKTTRKLEWYDGVRMMQQRSDDDK